MPIMEKKLSIGWFSFSCCEDSTIVFTELLNDHFYEWAKYIDFRHVRVLKKNNTLKDLDIAFVEGAITGDLQEQKLKTIRQKAKKLVAIGSCAVIGSPSNQRNFFNRSQLDEIMPILQKFKYKEKVLKLSDIVTVDETIPGCPMNEQKFLELINKFLNF